MTLGKVIFLVFGASLLGLALGCGGAGQEDSKKSLQDLKDTEAKLQKDLLRFKPILTDSGPIQITVPDGSHCVASPGAYQLPNPATNVTLQWGSPGSAYNVIFPAHQNPADPGNSASTTVTVPAKGYSSSIAVAQMAQDNCTNAGLCVYTYTVTPALSGSCMGSSGTFGFIIKP